MIITTYFSAISTIFTNTITKAFSRFGSIVGKFTVLIQIAVYKLSQILRTATRHLSAATEAEVAASVILPPREVLRAVERSGKITTKELFS